MKPVYCFVHLSIQEFLAAVYMFHCYTNKDIEVLNDTYLDVFLSRVMDKSLKSKNGHLDLFVRFLHGLTLESNQKILGSLLGKAEITPEIIQRTVNSLKEKKTKIAPDRSINIFQCLIEMNDLSVSQEIQEFLRSENRSEKELSEIHCSALAYMLQMSEEVLEELDLKRYKTSLEGRLRLIPVEISLGELKLFCSVSSLTSCRLSETSCDSLVCALMSNPSHLTELDLSDNKLQDSGVKLLCNFLESPDCQLEALSLWECRLTRSSCHPLVLALKSNPSHLRELDMRDNYLKNYDVKALIDLQKNPDYRLEMFRSVGGCY
uniref:NACHT LRR and PYD domain-containing protein n=1 Tax=Neolamprologus brichardi TaxID=32507 RepID=A0A3Q4GPL3_NEOBR